MLDPAPTSPNCNRPPHTRQTGVEENPVPNADCICDPTSIRLRSTVFGGAPKNCPHLAFAANATAPQNRLIHTFFRPRCELCSGCRFNRWLSGLGYSKNKAGPVVSSIQRGRPVDWFIQKSREAIPDSSGASIHCQLVRTVPSARRRLSSSLPGPASGNLVGRTYQGFQTTLYESPR